MESILHAYCCLVSESSTVTFLLWPSLATTTNSKDSRYIPVAAQEPCLPRARCAHYAQISHVPRWASVPAVEAVAWRRIHDARLSLYIEEDENPGKRANSVLSLASTAASTMTKSGIYRDPRDTQRRRNRHKDQTLLRAGMGLTTGLGWSDSEDEDAPSLLTRRLITTNIARQPSVYSTTSRAPSQLAKSHSVGNLSHAPPSYSPAP
ncbi:hypothetical protein C8Q76DRAFT_185233 [Earliella scabrosa]|nr:hypothetical protein C8Q76DRAFT_185233 [Earliella scabrosa]